MEVLIRLGLETPGFGVGLAADYASEHGQNLHAYRKTPKNLDTHTAYCDNPKIWLIWIFHREMRPEDADGIANSVGPDQTAPGRHCLLRPVCPKI